MENEGELADLKDELADLYQEMETAIIKAGEPEAFVFM